MQRAARLQLIGPFVLFGAVLAAETAAFALAAKPSSGFLWYLNLEIFGLFRKSRAVLGDLAFPFAQLVLFAGPLLALTVLGHALRRNLMVALASNLSLFYAGFLFMSWHFWHTKGLKAASLAPMHVPNGNEFIWFVALLLASLLSAAASHLLYIRAVRARR
jgi:hypothetical protein